MMKTTLEIRTEKALICSQYDKGNLRKITLKRGQFSPEQWRKIGWIIPPSLGHLAQFQEQFQGKIAFDIIENKSPKSPSLWGEFVQKWFDFYQRQFGISPKFTSTDARHLKGIVAYLNEVCSDEAQALNTWAYLLENWHRWDEFHRKNTDLKYINSQLNKIVQNAREFTSSGSKSKYSTEFKRQLFEDLHP